MASRGFGNRRYDGLGTFDAAVPESLRRERVENERLRIREDEISAHVPARGFRRPISYVFRVRPRIPGDFEESGEIVDVVGSVDRAVSVPSRISNDRRRDGRVFVFRWEPVSFFANRRTQRVHDGFGLRGSLARDGEFRFAGPVVRTNPPGIRPIRGSRAVFARRPDRTVRHGEVGKVATGVFRIGEFLYRLANSAHSEIRALRRTVGTRVFRCGFGRPRCSFRQFEIREFPIFGSRGVDRHADKAREGRRLRDFQYRGRTVFRHVR